MGLNWFLEWMNGDECTKMNGKCAPFCGQQNINLLQGMLLLINIIPTKK